MNSQTQRFICTARLSEISSLLFILFSLAANTLLDLGKNLDNPSEYAIAVDNQLGDFAFPDDFIFDIWGSINDGKAGRI